MTRYEYRVEFLNIQYPTTAQEELDKWGAEGWAIAASTRAERSDLLYLILARLVPEPEASHKPARKVAEKA